MFVVYLLMEGDDVVYIGQTKDIDGRIRKHLRGSFTTPKKTFTDYQCWRSFETRQEAFREETRLLKAFLRKYERLPKYNRESDGAKRKYGDKHPVGYKALIEAIFKPK